MLATIYPYKTGGKEDKGLGRGGISVISCQGGKGDQKGRNNDRGNGGPGQRVQTRKRDSYRPLRSLSAERVRRKKEKISKKVGRCNQDLIGDVAVALEQMKQNLSQLEAQYDQLRLKRSLMTQRQSQKSTSKARLSDIDGRSDTKMGSSALVLSKCVPKSKINLNILNPNTNSNSETMKQNSSQVQNQLGKNRQNSTSSSTHLQVSHLSESICSSSLTNLQVIPIGLNITLSRTVNQPREPLRPPNEISNSSLLYRSFHRKKGIKVLSSKKEKFNCPPSLNASVVSLQVMRKVEEHRDRSVGGFAQCSSIFGSCRRDISQEYCRS